MTALMRLVIATLAFVSPLATYAAGGGASKAVAVSDAALSAINAARTVMLSEKVQPVKTDKSLEDIAVNMVMTHVDDDNCVKKNEPLQPHAARGLVLIANSHTPPDAKEIAHLIGTQLSEGLKIIKESNYPASGEFKTTLKPFNQVEPQNIAFLMHARSDTVGCAAVSSCKPGGKSRVYCVFKPTLEDQSPPFSPGLYAAMMNRDAAGFKIADHIEKDGNQHGNGALFRPVPISTIVAFSVIGLMATH